MPDEIGTSASGGQEAPPSAPGATPASPGGGALPSETITEASSPSDVGGGDEFLGLGGDSDDTVEFDISQQEVEIPQEVTPPAEQAPPPTQTPAKVEPPAETPPLQATPPQGNIPPPAAEVERPLSEQLVEHREALIDALAAERFALSPQEEEALETDAVAEMPKLLSKVYYETMRSVVNHIQNNVPQLIRHMMTVMNAEQGAEQKFFQQFDGLDPQKHGPDIVMFANAFRQQNPQLTEDQLMSLVGTAVMSKYGLAPKAKPNGNGKVVPQPFVPARPGTSRVVTPEDSPFAGLGMDFD